MFQELVFRLSGHWIELKTARGAYGLTRSHNTCTALAETDRNVSVALGARLEDNFVAVIEILAAFTIRQPKRLPMLQQAGPALVGGARDRAAAQQVAGLQIAAVAGVVRDHLREAPIRIFEIRRDYTGRRIARFEHARGRKEDLQIDVDSAFRAIGM